MAKRNEATRLLQGGMYLDQIADHMGVSFQTVVRYMKLQVAEGALRISEVFFGLQPARRKLLESLLATTEGRATKKYYADARNRGISWDEANLYWSLRESRVFRGDMYEHIADLEVELHSFVRRVLQDEFGCLESGWWRKGIPASIRKSCVQVREDDPDPVQDVFAYTTFIHLSEIIDRQWSLFAPKLPQQWTINRKTLMSQLIRMNEIRNAVMHPVKNKRWDESDFLFVREFLKQMRTVTGTLEISDKGLHRSVRYARH